LIAFRSDEADLTGADSVVDPVLFALWRRGYGCSPLCNGCVSCVRWLDAKSAEHNWSTADAARSLGRWTRTHLLPGAWQLGTRKQCQLTAP
jgi:hypothetical protein